ncbi:hypothetical protein BDZ97DRAFT_42261 [Flammula alnicola]|nr:hypothetical protein BDZ97DRAFT_42261 [Flammula alnicola]
MKLLRASRDAAESKIVTDSEHTVSPVPPAGYPQLLSDIADTIAARDGTSSALDYVASGLGAACIALLDWTQSISRRSQSDTQT